MTQRILLVDDEPRNLLLLEAILSRTSVTTVRAANGAEALEILESTPIDLVLLDLRMPGIDGIDVLIALRARELTAHLPVILVTASSEREQRLRGLRAGADDFIEKPVDADVLLARVKTLLGLKAARDELAARNVMLEQLQREQRELSEMIVHDLKNPIGVAKMCLDFVLSDDARELNDRVDLLLDASAAVQQMQSFAEQLLLVARLERADFPLKPERVAVQAMLRQVQRFHLREATRRNVATSVSGLSDVSVSADPSLLRRVIENLVSNALRHTPAEGSVHLESTLSGHVEIVVSNTGSYIKPEHREHIFEKFWRDPKAPEATVHVGLGLYFCRRAIEAHGGTITVTESERFPTNFVVQLPA